MVCPELELSHTTDAVMRSPLDACEHACAHQHVCDDEEKSSAMRDACFTDEEPPFNPVPVEFLGKFFDVIPGRLSFTIHCDDEHTKQCIKQHPQLFFFSSWMQEAYDSFCSDFGPVNISIVIQFCDLLKEKLSDPRIALRHLVYYCEPDTNFASNCAFLLSSYLVLHENFSPEKAAARFQAFSSSPHFPAFRDASPSPSTFDLSILDCLRGLRRAVESNVLDVKSFDVAAYDALDDPRVADLHIICPKFVAFRGPNKTHFAHPPAHYVPLFQSLGVESVVRLNEASTYDKNDFEQHGISHYDLEFADGSAPSLADCRRFLDICDASHGRVAVHCMAGLGRTGTMIGVWLMREYGWSAREAIAWVRLVRPGSIVGPQQHFLERCETLLGGEPSPLLGPKSSPISEGSSELRVAGFEADEEERNAWGWREALDVQA